jgi:hypothetical protein
MKRAIALGFLLLTGCNDGSNQSAALTVAQLQIRDLIAGNVALESKTSNLQSRVEALEKLETERDSAVKVAQASPADDAAWVLWSWSSLVKPVFGLSMPGPSPIGAFPTDALCIIGAHNQKIDASGQPLTGMSYYASGSYGAEEIHMRCLPKGVDPRRPG